MGPANHGPGVVDAFDVHDQMATTFGCDASEWRDYTALDRRLGDMGSEYDDQSTETSPFWMDEPRGRETKVPLDYALGELASLARRYDLIDAEEKEEEEEEEVLLYSDDDKGELIRPKCGARRTG